MNKDQKKSINTCPIKCVLSNYNNKKIIIAIIIIIAVIIFGTVITIINNQKPNTTIADKTESKIAAQNLKNSADTLEVYYFHRTQRCYSCNTVSQYAKETIEQKFSEEIANNIIDFREINVDLPENKEVAIKFQASGSSLFINDIKNGQDNISQDANVWRLLNNKSQFKNYLENKINSLLGK